MAVFKCKMCGGEIGFAEGASVGTCGYCGTKQTLPHLNDERRANLYDRANHFRRNNEFDKAAGIYEQILSEDTADAEAYWSLILCRYGIEYVEDPATHKRLPTVNRAQFTSIFADEDYKSAIANADPAQRALYEAEAKEIDMIQKGILAISQKEEPFDVFICYKETDQNGRRTPDSVLAGDLYHQLTAEGFKVFFSRITLEDKLGTAYEPYIFAALNSAKVMVVLGTKKEYFNAVWVKNEWSRYLTLVKESGGKKTLIPAYRDMDPYDLPDEFSHLQAQDMAKLGFMQDLIRGIKKLTAQPQSAPVEKQTTVVQNESGNLTAILDRGFFALEDGDFAKADVFFEQSLNFDARNAQAYLGKLMAELKARTKDALKDQPQPFDQNVNYQKALRFGDEKLKTFIKESNDQAVYNNAAACMKKQCEEGYRRAAKLFASIPGFKDADELVKICPAKAEFCRKDALYQTAKKRMDEKSDNGYTAAEKLFSDIPGHRDADSLRDQCERILDDRAKKEQEKKETKEKRTIIVVVTAALLLCVGVFCLVFASGVFDKGSKGLEYKGGTVTGIGTCKDIEIVIPERHGFQKVTSIGDRAFYGCTSLTSVTIGNGVTSIGNGAFFCSSLKSVTIPDSVTSIDEYAFYNCQNLTNVTIPDGVTLIGEGAFYNCTSLTSVAIGNSVTSIGEKAFYNCQNLTSVTIPDNVTTIGEYAFYYCTNLKSVTIGTGVTSIGKWVFEFCFSLSSVTIPDSVTSICHSAFYGCAKLKTVYYRGSLSQWSMISIDSYNDRLKNAEIVYDYRE